MCLAERYCRSGADLAPSPTIDLAVHADLAALDQGPGMRTIVDDSGQLQELTQPDHLSADRNLDGVAHAARHAPVVDKHPLLAKLQLLPKLQLLAKLPPG